MQTRPKLSSDLESNRQPPGGMCDWCLVPCTSLFWSLCSPQLQTGSCVCVAWQDSWCCALVSQIEKGKLHGSIDVGLSVMAIKKKAMCIDLDAEENIYHLKVKCNQINWLTVDFPPIQTCTKIPWTAGELQAFLDLNHFSSRPPEFCLIASSDEIAGPIWWVGVEAAAPPPLSAERDLHVLRWPVL